MTLPGISSLAVQNFNLLEIMSHPSVISNINNNNNREANAIDHSQMLQDTVENERREEEMETQQREHHQTMQQSVQQQQQQQQQQRHLHGYHLQSLSTLASTTTNTITSTTNTATTIPSATNVATASATIFSSHELAVENIMPGIYLTKNFVVWNEKNLNAHGFTHIIIIDKHIQELYYPSPLFKFCTQSDNADDISAFEQYYPPIATTVTAATTRTGASATVTNAAANTRSANEMTSTTTSTTDRNITIAKRSLSFSKDFEAINLNFGEKSYLTTVLPNCYRAVRFINKALSSGGTILVIDCNGGEQKCLTIVVAYLMYKSNISFSAAFARLKEFYKKADLDRFYMSQLYEYEPILQVQRAQSRGHSCSREMNASVFKRKKSIYEEDIPTPAPTAPAPISLKTIDKTMDFFNNLNPLTQFKVDIAENDGGAVQNPPLNKTNTKLMNQLSSNKEMGGEKQQLCEMKTVEGLQQMQQHQQHCINQSLAASRNSYLCEDYAME